MSKIAGGTRGGGCILLWDSMERVGSSHPGCAPRVAAGFVERGGVLKSATCIASLLATVSVVFAADWSLSGKVVDAEEGNGLNLVTVSLAKAGLRASTAKNGTWSIATTGIGDRSRGVVVRKENSLRMQEGRLRLHLDGADILGRILSEPGRNLSTAAARALGDLDTLVYTKDGYIQKRVPLASSAMTGIVDSIRRIRGAEWVDSSHSNGFKPDSTDAFPDTLRAITLRITKVRWDRMMKSMVDSCGAFGTQPHCSTSNLDHIDNSALLWVPGDLEADGQVWKNVGIRLKGNGSLEGAWLNGQYTLPFRVTMDKFEDSFPTVKNQRFHGYQKLSLYNASQDASDIREAVASEVMRAAGVPASLSVPVRLKIVFGDTTKDLGPYSMVEVPDNPLLNRNFGNDTGNLYKPMSQLNTFVESEFFDDDLKTDYADVKALIAAINAGTRSSAPATWRAGLEKAIDIHGWIKWLAVSDAIGNWDEYGIYPHNYYLYNDKGLLRWITYDLGWSLVDLTDELIWHAVPNTEGYVFPLVDNVMADPVYCKEYKARLIETISDTGAFSAASFKARVDRYGKLVSSIPSTARYVAELKTYTDRRHPLVRAAANGHACP